MESSVRRIFADLDQLAPAARLVDADALLEQELGGDRAAESDARVGAAQGALRVVQGEEQQFFVEVEGSVAHRVGRLTAGRYGLAASRRRPDAGQRTRAPSGQKASLQGRLRRRAELIRPTIE